MSYDNGHAIPNWDGYLSGLQEVLEEVLFTIQQNKQMGVRPDISCLEAFDYLNTYLDGVKGELGIL